MTDPKQTEIVTTEQPTFGEVEVTQPHAPAPITPDNGLAAVGQILQSAVERGLDPDGIEKLVGLWRQAQADEAKKLFNAALLGFQSDCPVVVKSKKVHYKTAKGVVDYDFAPIDYLVATIKPHLQRHGLTYSWDEGESTDSQLIILTTIRHTSGHSETTTTKVAIDPRSPLDTTKARNSAMSVGQRYGIRAALGIVTGGDDDGNSMAGKPISEKQMIKLQEMIDSSGANLPGFLKMLNVDQLAHIPEQNYQVAYNLLRQKAGTK